MTQEQLELFKKYEGTYNYSREELDEISLAIEHNLTVEQVAFMVKSSEETSLKYDWQTMQLVRLCYEKGVEQKEIEELLNKNFNKEQLDEILEGLKNDLTIEEIKAYANPLWSVDKMKAMRLKLQEYEYNKLFNKIVTELEKSQELDNQELKTKESQENQIDKTKKEKLLQKYKDMGIEDFKLREIILAIESNCNEEQLDFIAQYNQEEEIYLARLCCEKDIQLDEIEELLNAKFEAYQLKEISKGLENGLTLDEVKIYANPKYGCSQMIELRELLEDNLVAETKLTQTQIDFIASADLEYYEMNFIRVCYQENINFADINYFLHKNFNYQNFNQFSLGLKNGLTIDEIKTYANRNLYSEQMAQIRLGLEYNLTAEQKITQEQFEFMIDLQRTREMWLARVCFENNVPQNEIEELLIQDFDENQIEEIVMGLENGLTIDEVKSYAYEEMSWLEMQEARECLEWKHEQEPEQEQSLDELIKNNSPDSPTKGDGLDGQAKDDGLTTDDGPDGDELV